MVATLENYVYACTVDQLPPRGKKTIHIDDDLTILIVACESGLYAVEDCCPQTGRQIGRGKVLNCVLTAPTTGAQYDLATGRYVGGGLSPFQSHWLTVFPIQVVENTVYVRLPNR
ncbi:MAG: nitrite reductase (NAD(P)H) small subunit [Anaerolineae bacterium]|nr:nitrite reductase (NAD(P)H) small subunit [Anaerolineae bacterium]